MDPNRSHSKGSHSFQELLKRFQEKIIACGDLPHASVQQQLDILHQFAQFRLGRYILEHRGANGFWTDYMISHPEKGRKTGLNIDAHPFSPLEALFLDQLPILTAHQERFQIFQKLSQQRLKEGAVLASIPCGLMRDLITLDYSHISDYQLIGVDLDPESLALAKQLACDFGVDQHLTLIQQDAWKLSLNNEVDLLTSSGLNVYESDPVKLLELYSRFYTALKPGGELIISVLTYPPGEENPTDWDLSGFAEETLLIDRILHKDILDIKWRNFRSSGELDREFCQVGFSDVSIYFDKNKIFPTVVARK